MHGVGGQKLIFVNLVTMLGIETQKSILGREFQEVLVHASFLRTYCIVLVDILKNIMHLVKLVKKGNDLRRPCKMDAIKIVTYCYSITV